MALYISGINNYNNNISKSGSNNSNGKPVGNIDFINKKKEELCKLLNLTSEQYDLIVASNPDFPVLNTQKQAEIVTKFQSAQMQQQNTQGENNTERVIQGTNTNQETVDNSQNDLSIVNYAIKFDHKNFASLSNDEKLKVYAEELAKNKFILGDADAKKTVENWNNLSEQEKQALIDNEYKLLLKKDDYKNKSEEIINLNLQKDMNFLQAANFYEESIDTFNNKNNFEHRQDALHDYIFAISEDPLDPGKYSNLTEEQIKYLEKQKELTNAVLYEAKKQGLDKLDYSKYSWAQQDLDKCIMGLSEIKVYCKDLGKNIFVLERDYLKSKSNIDKDTQKKIDNLDGVIDFLNFLNANKDHDYGRYDEFLQSSGLEGYSNISAENKIKYLKEYAATTYSSLPDEERARATRELMSDALNSDPELLNLMEGWFGDLSNEGQKALIESCDESASVDYALNANAKALTIENNKVLANKNIRLEDPKQRKIFAELHINSVYGERLLAATVYAGSPDIETQSLYSNASYDKNRVNAEQQLKISNAINENSCLEVRKQHGARYHEAYKENQTEVARTFMQDKDVAQYMNENGHLELADKDNQTDIFKCFQNRFLADDFSKEESIVQLNTLSDKIQYCDVDNQLDMHNSIMQSPYSEVIEHVANNIQNYDPSVQYEAYESVYASGNSNAIEIAIANSGQAPAPVQEVVLKPILNAAFDSEQQSSVDSFLKKIKEGSYLTPQEYSSLTNAEKKAYKAAFFKNLSPLKQIALLNRISDIGTKKAIFKRIAQNNSGFLKTLIQSSADTAKFIYDMHIADETVEQIANQKANSNIHYRNLLNTINNDRIKHEVAENNHPRTSANIPYSSIPLGFKGSQFELFLRDEKSLLG